MATESTAVTRPGLLSGHCYVLQGWTRRRRVVGNIEGAQPLSTL